MHQDRSGFQTTRCHSAGSPSLRARGSTHAPSRERGPDAVVRCNHLLGLCEVQTDLTVACARVSSHDQKEDLRRQAENLEPYCAKKGWRYELIQDLGSGMNYRKKGLKRLWK